MNSLSWPLNPPIRFIESALDKRSILYLIARKFIPIGRPKKWMHLVGQAISKYQMFRSPISVDKDSNIQTFSKSIDPTLNPKPNPNTLVWEMGIKEDTKCDYFI
jgi:hypothetical protein